MSFFGFKSNTCLALAIIATTVALTACGSSSDATLDTEAILAAQTPCSMSAHSGASTGAIEKACITTSPSVSVDPKLNCQPAALSNSGYSLVFKGCSAANEPVYYDKTECVRDNVTGLIWQGHTPAGTGLRANDAFRINYDNTKSQKASVDGVDFYVGIEIPNTIDFEKDINDSNLCGSSTWRFPTADELQSIQTNHIRVNSYPEPNDLWYQNINLGTFYWTSPPNMTCMKVFKFKGLGFFDNVDFSNNVVDVLPDRCLARMVR